MIDSGGSIWRDCLRDVTEWARRLLVAWVLGPELATRMEQYHDDAAHWEAYDTRLKRRASEVLGVLEA